MQTRCDILEIAPSRYYYQPQERDELDLRAAVETGAVHYRRSGSRRITAELRRRGWQIHRKPIQRVMREENEARSRCGETRARR